MDFFKNWKELEGRDGIKKAAFIFLCVNYYLTVAIASVRTTDLLFKTI